jgi:hypothetical protein
LDIKVPYPDAAYYEADFNSDYGKSEFLAWLEEQKGNTFNNKDELLAYCMDDVNELRQACCAFRNLISKFVNIGQFRQAITISSICNRVFRTMFLKSDTVGVIPRGGYHTRDRQSVEALQCVADMGR